MALNRNPYSQARNALREVLTGGAIRAIAGIRDAGEAILAKVTNLDGGDHIDDSGSLDVWCHYEDALTGHPGIARLFFPLNALFGTPNDGDSAMALRPRDGAGPGQGYLLHGDAGGGLPAWIRDKIGLWHSKTLRVESTGGDVELEVPSGQHIKLGPAASRGVARLNDTTDCGALTIAAAGTTDLVITYTPPGGSPQVTTITFASASPVSVTAVPPTESYALSGVINSASTKSEAE